MIVVQRINNTLQSHNVLHIEACAVHILYFWVLKLLLSGIEYIGAALIFAVLYFPMGLS